MDSYSTKLDEHIRTIVEKEEYVTYEINKINLSCDGGSYMGNLFVIDVKGKTKDGSKETNIFVKQMVNIEIPMIYDVKNIYQREIFIYTDLIKELRNLQDKGNVPVAERLRFAKSFDQSYNQAIILENLGARGFKTYSRTNVISLEYAVLAVKNLARLHGLSLAMKVKNPGYFEKKVKNLDCVYIFNDYFRGFTHTMLESVTPLLTDDVRERLEPLLKNIVDKYPAYMTDASCPIKTICHGDYRHNNIMVKEIDGKPSEVIAVDYQITFYGNPVLDFIYLIFWGTDQEFRMNHLENLKQLYHEYLGTYLSYLDIEVNNVFPIEEFEKQYKEKLDFGLMIAVFYLPCLFPPEDDIPDFSKRTEKLDESAVKVDKKFVERFRGIVDDFIQWGYL